MIKLKYDDLAKLEKTARGGFGTIYRDNDVVKVGFARYADNPCLKYNRFKLNELKKMNGTIKYTDFVKDVVFVDGKFSGIVLPYYEGDSLNNKLNIARQIVRNSKELTDNKIYPLDYKMSNILVDSNDVVKFIDLDDTLTIVSLFKNNKLLEESIILLDKTLKAFFEDTRSYYFGNDDIPNCTYQDIYKYLDDKKKRKNVIKIKSIYGDCYNADLVNLIRDDNSVIFITYEILKDKKFYFNLLNYYKENDIPIYDVLYSGDVNTYIRNSNVVEVSEICGGKVLSKKKNITSDILY